MILLSFAIDPHGRFGPLTRAFLSSSDTPIAPIKFPRTRPHARTMHHRATTHPCPTGILQTANIHWKHTSTRRFYGFSHTAPTPYIHMMQQLGLGITKAFTLHLRNCTKRDIMKRSPQPSASTSNPLPPQHNTPTPNTHNPPQTYTTEHSHSE